jgi:hypothetical protein
VACSECGSKETEIQDYTEKKVVLEVLRRQIKRVKNWKMEIDELKRREKEREYIEKNKNLENHRVTDVDKDVVQAN